MMFSAKAATLLATLALLFAPSIAIAQQRVPNPMLIDGRVAGCGEVPIYLDNSIDDIAIARPFGIVLNWAALSRRPTELKLFVFAHECAHMLFGNSEATADCWAIQTGKRQGWFTAESFRFLVEEFKFNPGSYTHMPGPQRIEHLAQCFESA